MEKYVNIFFMFSTVAEKQFKYFLNVLYILYVHASIKTLNIYTEKINLF